MLANITEFIKESHKNQGSSYNLVTGELNPNSGYMCSLSGHEATFDNLSEDVVRHYIMSKAEVIYEDENLFIGSWYNPNDQKWYLDISEKRTDLETTIFVGILGGQKAIYDLKRNESVELPTPSNKTMKDRMQARMTAVALSQTYLTKKALGL